MRRKWMTKADAALLAVLLVCGGAFLAWRQLSSPQSLTAEVTVSGEPILQVDLSADLPRQLYSLENGVTLVAENGTIAFLESDCPDALCVQAGKLSARGDVAACVPNATVVSLKGEGRAEVDAVAY